MGVSVLVGRFWVPGC